MIRRCSKWMIPAALGAILAACDAGQAPPDEGNLPDNGIESAPSGPSNASNAGESIIREDVLAETDVPAEPEAEPLEIMLDFAEAEGGLPPAAAPKLDALLKEPLVADGGCIVIRAHTDSRGSDAQNLRVSERRARRVGDYLADRGVSEDRLRLVALGERRPIAPNAHPDGSDYPEGRARNRRVTVEAHVPEAGRAAPCSDANRGRSPAE